ncbi:MAG: CBS domain-containing protein [Phycisphaerae bacterium]
MFGKGLKFFTLFGIPVRIDVSFLLVLPIFVFVIASQILLVGQEIDGEIIASGDIPLGSYAQQLQGGITPYVIGLALAVCLFVSVLIHEFGHALTARLYDVQTQSITLWFLGGVASFTRMPRQPGAEAVVAVAGPIVSFAIAGVMWGLYAVAPEQAWLKYTTGWLALVNAVLAVFNCLPALPLDGGRILRSLLALAMPYVKATRIAAGVSKVLAAALALFALSGFIDGTPWGGSPWLVLIAVFVWFAVNAETRQAIVEDMLKGVRVRDIMNPNVESVSPATPAGDVLTRMMQGRRTGFPVCNGRGCEGIVDLQQLHGVDPVTPVSQVMRPEVPKIRPEAPAREAFELMGRQSFNRILVVDPQGELLGIVTKTDLIRTIQIRSAAGIPSSMRGHDEYDERADRPAAGQNPDTLPPPPPPPSPPPPSGEPRPATS